jgi:GNAT superfamily N-acetyltransferase
VLVDAFRNDVMWGNWAFPDPCHRRTNRHVVFRAFVAGALRYRATWVGPSNAAVAMWVPPGGTGLTADEEAALEAELRDRIGSDETSRIFKALDLFVDLEPAEPHYYLSLLGTDPAHAGRGHGKRVLAHSLAALDAEHAAAYLDCADDLVPLYARFGFRVVGSFSLPDGPRSNGMWRRPV